LTLKTSFPRRASRALGARRIDKTRARAGLRRAAHHDRSDGISLAETCHPDTRENASLAALAPSRAWDAARSAGIALAFSPVHARPAKSPAATRRNLMFNQRSLARGWNPWLEMQRLQSEMNRIFESVDRPQSAEFPAIELWSGEDGLKFHAQLPGFESDDIELSVVGDTLTLKATREEEKLEKGQTWHRRERVHGRFVRTIQLPFGVEADRVSASYTNGLLEVDLPRRASDKPRRIAVNAG
jgi:HSP20 family protein